MLLLRCNICISCFGVETIELPLNEFKRSTTEKNGILSTLLSASNQVRLKALSSQTSLDICRRRRRRHRRTNCAGSSQVLWVACDDRLGPLCVSQTLQLAATRKRSHSRRSQNRTTLMLIRSHVCRDDVKALNGNSCSRRRTSNN